MMEINIQRNAFMLILALASMAITPLMSAMKPGERRVVRRIENLLAKPNKNNKKWQMMVEAQLNNLSNFNDPATLANLQNRYNTIIGVSSVTATSAPVVAVTQAPVSMSDAKVARLEVAIKNFLVDLEQGLASNGSSWLDDGRKWIWDTYALFTFN